MRNFTDKKSGTIHKPKISQEFDSLDEAYDFYNLYSWETGFGIKYGQCRRNMDKCKMVQDMVFGCQVVNIFDSRHVNLAVLQGRVHFAIVLMWVQSATEIVHGLFISDKASCVLLSS